MREFQEKHRIKRKIYSKTALFILLCILVLTARGVLNVYAKEKESRKDLEQVQKQEALLATRAVDMQEHSDHIRTSAGVEAEIRSKFDVAKEGEGVIVLVDKPLPVVVPQETNVIKRWWNSVVSIFNKPDAATTTAENTVSANAAVAGTTTIKR